MLPVAPRLVPARAQFNDILLGVCGPARPTLPYGLISLAAFESDSDEPRQALTRRAPAAAALTPPAKSPHHHSSASSPATKCATSPSVRTGRGGEVARVGLGAEPAVIVAWRDDQRHAVIIVAIAKYLSLHILRNAGRRRNGQTVFLQSVNMKPDGIADFTLDIRHASAGCDAAR